jgi:monoamine oxidase
LAHTLKTTEVFIKEQLSAWQVSNWSAAPYFGGAYYYDTPEAKEAKKILCEPVENMLFFAGEAINEKGNSATVESALESAEQVVKKILTKNK